MTALTKISIVVIFFAYLIFGLFILDVPSVKSDELWDTSIAYYMKNHHHPGNPLLPVEVAPFFATVQDLGWESWFIGSLKSGTTAIWMSVLPVDPRIAIRLNGFFWSVAVCFLTFIFARKLHLSKWNAMLSAALLIVLPEFFQQVHSYRAEMPVAALFLIGLLMLLKAFESGSAGKKKIWLLLTGLYAWLPPLLMHPSAVVIPVTIGILFLLKERKNIFSANTLLIGIGLLGGMFFFFYIKGAMGNYAVGQGGTDFFDSHACPPVLCEGWKYLIQLPIIFYNKFVKANVLTQPVSFFFFIFSLGCLIFKMVKRKKVFADDVNGFLLLAISTPLIVLLLFSPSYGNYNVIAAPLIAISMVFYLKDVFDGFQQGDSFTRKIIIPVLLFLVLGTNAIGMKNQYTSTQQYRQINDALKKIIPPDARVIGMALYYLPFRDQEYTSVTWFEPTVGKPGLSFEQVVRMKKINYIIEDDAFASRANFRGASWADSLVNFLRSNTTMVSEFNAKMYLKIIPDSSRIPVQFRYPQYEQNYVKRIRVYKVNG